MPENKSSVSTLLYINDAVPAAINFHVHSIHHWLSEFYLAILAANSYLSKQSISMQEFHQRKQCIFGAYIGFCDHRKCRIRIIIK